MKKKNYILYVWLCFILLFIGKDINVSAAETRKDETITLKKKDVEVYDFIYTDKNSIFMLYVESNLKYEKDYGKGQDDDITISIWDDEEIEEVYSYKMGDNWWGYISVDNEDLKEDNLYYFEISNDSGYDYSIKYKVLEFKSYSTDISIPSNMNLKVDEYKEVKVTHIVPKDSFPEIEWTSGNEKIAKVDERGYVIGIGKGTCKITATLENGKKYHCTVNVTYPAPKLNFKSFELYTGESNNIKLKYVDKKVKWKSSNNKIATVSSTGKIKAKKVGSCIISTKYAGKTYKAKVKVLRQPPDFTAYLTGYNTRNNYFTVKINNKSNKSLTIYSAKAYSMDVDYKSFDRKLKLSGGKKSITIKPHKKATVKFKIIGRNTWPDYTDHTVRFYFAFDGKKYLGSVWDEDSSYKDGKKWYSTYLE